MKIIKPIKGIYKNSDFVAPAIERLYSSAGMLAVHFCTPIYGSVSLKN